MYAPSAAIFTTQKKETQIMMSNQEHHLIKSQRTGSAPYVELEKTLLKNNKQGRNIK